MIPLYKNLSNGNQTVKFVRGCGPNGIGIISFYGCNFRCPFCFAQKYNYSTREFPIDSERRVYLNKDDFAKDIVEFLKMYPNICYIQLTGENQLSTRSKPNRQ